MEKIVIALFWIVELFEVRSSDPVLAAFKRARRSLVLCMAGQLLLLAMGFSFAPETGIEPTTNAIPVAQVREIISNVFAVLALVCSGGMVFFAVRCLHIWYRPEQYIDQ